MAVTLRARRPFLQVLVDGQPLRGVLQARATHGLDQETAEAQIRAPLGTPSWVRLWSRVTVVMGATAGTARARFTGYVVGFSSTMWPGELGIVCKGPLYKAATTMGSGQDLAGLTDTEIVAFILTACGIAPAEQQLFGLNETMGTTVSGPDDTRFIWTEDRSGLSMIQQVDQASRGYLTLDSPSGTVRRRWISSIPRDAYTYRFTEGDDILSGTGSVELVLPKNKVTAVGWQDVSATATVPNPSIGAGLGTVGVEIKNPLIETAAQARDVAGYFLAELNRTLVRAEYATPSSVLLEAGMTVFTDAPRRLEIQQPCWLQRTEAEVDEDGAFTQSVGVISDLGLSDVNRTVGPGGVAVASPIPALIDTPTDLDPGLPLYDQIPAYTQAPPPWPATGTGASDPGPPDPPGPGEPGGPGGPGGPVDPDLQADFSVISSMAERVIVGGAATTLTDVYVEDTTVPLAGEVVARSWSASAGAKVASGDGPTFVTAFPSLAGATITLQVTDANGRVATVTKSVAEAGASAPQLRKLYAAATADAEAFDGAQWRTDSPAGSVDVVGNGQLWGAGTAALTSEDDLATPAVASDPFGGAAAVTAVWTEVDVSTTRVAAGGSHGGVALSADGGASWEPSSGPGGGPVLKIILSRDNQDEVHVLTADGWYQSGDNGSTWGLVRAAAGGQAFRDLELSHHRNAIASEAGGGGAPLERAEDGTAFTFPALTPPVTDVVSVFADIRADKFFAIDAGGRTFVTEEDGGTAMVQAESLPAGTAQPRGGYRDGAIPGLLYFAVGADGVWKTLDGFGSSGGYQQLRAPGVDGAGSGPWPMVGAGAPVLPGGDFTWIATSSASELARLRDDGTGEATPGAVTRLVAGPQQSQGLFSDLSTGGSLFSHSADQGATWSGASTPGGGGFESAASGIAAGAANIGYCMTIVSTLTLGENREARLWKTTNGGASWSILESVVIRPLFSTDTGFELVGIDLWANAAGAWWPIQQLTGVEVTILSLLRRTGAGGGSVDYALSGTTITGVAPNHDNTDSALVSTDASVFLLSGGSATDIGAFNGFDIWGSTIYATVGSTIRKSTNGGGSWSTIATLTEALGAIRFSESDQNRLIVCAAGSSKFWITNDAGATWTPHTIADWAADHAVNRLVVF